MTGAVRSTFAHDAPLGDEPRREGAAVAGDDAHQVPAVGQARKRHGCDPPAADPGLVSTRTHWPPSPPSAAVLRSTSIGAEAEGRLEVVGRGEVDLDVG